jgi:dsRNA-specific ribonuclease
MFAGINTLINIMSRFGKKTVTESNITHNERLEFLGDAVVEFLTSIHLFHMFPDLEEGGLATYRAAIVQNQHLAVLAKVRTTMYLPAPRCLRDKAHSMKGSYLGSRILTAVVMKMEITCSSRTLVGFQQTM